jgi:hypothetical protein
MEICFLQDLPGKAFLVAWIGRRTSPPAKNKAAAGIAAASEWLIGEGRGGVKNTNFCKE